MKAYRSIFLAAAAAFIVLNAQAGRAEVITGAGATFPQPIYSKWAQAYNEQTSARINYQSVGSGAGIKLITAKSVDFGASDDPLTPETLAQLGLVQFPAVIGAVVPVVNLPDIESNKLKLDAAVLADIYLKNITQWDDPRIAALNPGVSLPKKAISVVQRADSSGTTAIFTDYLSKVSPEWKEKIGAGKSVKWIKGGLGGKGNEGVASYVKQIEGSIGYVEYAYAKQNQLATVQLKNHDGQYVSASAASAASAASHADWKGAKDYYLMLTDMRGAASWPITSQTNILLYKEPQNCASTGDVLKFFNWAFNHGSKMAEELAYVPLPADLVQQVRGTWIEAIKCEGLQAAIK